jgi:hypothetical protein
MAGFFTAYLIRRNYTSSTSFSKNLDQHASLPAARIWRVTREASPAARP